MMKSEREAVARAANVQMLEAHGMTVSGGMWGEAGWIVLPDGRVASICNAFMGLDDPQGGLIGLYVYSPPFQSDWSVREGEAPLSDEDEDAPCVHYHLDTWEEAYEELERLKRGEMPREAETVGMNEPLPDTLYRSGGLTPQLLRQMWVRVKDRDMKVTQIDMAAVADLGQGRELWFGIVSRRDKFVPFVTWHDDDEVASGPGRPYQVVKREYASDDMGEALGHLVTLLGEISNGAEAKKPTGEAGFLIGILDEIAEGRAKPGSTDEAGFGS